MSEQNLALVQEDFNKRIDATLEFLKSKMPRSEAVEHINHYRNNHPGAIKSVWLNREIIDFIVRNASSNMSGIRVYMAKYKHGVPPVVGNPGIENKETVILAPTLAGTTGDLDFPDSYFNFGRPCPPTCDGDAGQP